MNLDALAPLDAYPPLLTLTPAELESVARLGPDDFHRWAVKGWIVPPPPEA